MVDMNKKYRYQGSDVKLRRVVFTDGVLPDLPVASEDEDGYIRHHKADGKSNTWYVFNLIEVGPYDHIHDGDVIEIDIGNGRTILRRFCGTTEDGRIEYYLDGGEYKFTSTRASPNIRLAYRKDTQKYVIEASELLHRVIRRNQGGYLNAKRDIQLALGILEKIKVDE